MDKILIEKEEVLKRYEQMIAARIPAITAFLFIALLLKIFLKVPFSNLLFFLVSFMTISTVIYDFFFRLIRDPKISQIINGYFVYMLFDLIILTIVIYIIGGVTWIGFIFYGLYIYIGFLLFPRGHSLFYIFYCTLLYTLLTIIQYFKIFPIHEIFSSTERAPQNLSFVSSTWVAATIFLWVLGYYGDTFYKILQGKINELQKTKALLEEERASSEIRVVAETRELREERGRLEGKIRERTKELEEEKKNLAKRVSELEKFHRVAVGRELKMRELKKEITKLKTDSQS